MGSGVCNKITRGVNYNRSSIYPIVAQVIQQLWTESESPAAYLT